MCGVFGVIGKEPVSSRLIKGAERLQNRGERSTRVFTFDGNFFYDYGGLKPPAFLFLDYDHSKLRGNSGIVHTRYATTGSNDPEMLWRNMQPVYTNRPGMALCNNGDLINMVSLTQKQKERGFSFQTQVDAKVIQNELIQHMINNKIYLAESLEDFTGILFRSITEAHKMLNGAYAALALMERGLVAFKDPHGIRPLSMAHRVDEKGRIVEYAFASESSVFNYFGDYDDVRELEPGEAVFIDGETLKMKKKRLVKEEESFCFFEYIYFARPDSIFNGHRVEEIRSHMGKVLARQFARFRYKLDVVCGLPGTAVSTGQMFGEALKLPVQNAIIKTGSKRSFQETSDDKRKKAIDDKFIFIRDFIRDKRIAIIDDSNVRGTTAKKIIKRLYELGAREVHMFYYCPPIVSPCFYGIDTPVRERLIAYNRTLDEIREEMGCDSVNYISLDNLIKGLKHPKEKLCLACVTGNYPTDTSEINDRVCLRNTQREDEKRRDGQSGC